MLSLSGHQHTRELAPVGLGLRAGRRLDTAPSPDSGLWKMGLEVALQRTQAAWIVVFSHQPVVQGGEVFLLTASIGSSSAVAAQMIANSIFMHAQQSGDGAVSLTTLGNALDSHEGLLIEFVCHRASPSE